MAVAASLESAAAAPFPPWNVRMKILKRIWRRMCWRRLDEEETEIYSNVKMLSVLKLVSATARDEVSRLTRERNWNVWNPLREVVHQYKNQANRWFVNSAVASLFCWQNHYRRQDRTLFWGSNKKLDRCLLGWLLVSPNVFFRASINISTTSGYSQHKW